MILRSLAVLPFLVAAQDAPLRRPLVEGAKEAYETTLDLKLNADLPNGIGQQDLTAKSAIRIDLLLGKPAAEKAPLTLTTTVKTFELGGSLSNFLPTPPLPAPVASKGELDSRNRIRTVDVKGGDLVATLVSAQISAVSFLLVELPEGGLKPGTEWDVTVPKGPYTAPRDQTLKATYLADETIDGVAARKIGVKGTLDIELDGEKLGTTSLTSKGKAIVDSTAWIDAATAKTIKITTRFSTTSDVNAQGMDAKIAGEGTILTVAAK